MGAPDIDSPSRSLFAFPLDEDKGVTGARTKGEAMVVGGLPENTDLKGGAGVGREGSVGVAKGVSFRTEGGGCGVREGI
jgi:hypothetical protein